MWPLPAGCGRSFLQGMNIRLTEVLAQIQGKSGLAIIAAILNGERDPEQLPALCQGPIRGKKTKEVLAAL